MTEVKKRYIIGAQKEASGEIGYYINIDKEFYEKILSKKIRIFRGHSVTVDEVCGTMQTFNYGTIGAVMHQIEMHIRKAGFRKR